MFKKAHDLLLQAREERNLRKATLLRKASADTYNEMIAFSFIFGVINQDDNFTNSTMAMKAEGDLVKMVTNLIADKYNLKGIKSKIIAKRYAIEFFNVEELAQQKFYEKMIKDFTFVFKAVDKAEDAVQNMLSGLNPVTESEFIRKEAFNPFAHAGKEHRNLNIVLSSSISNNVYPIPNKYQDCIASILSTIAIYTQRLKYNRSSIAPIPMSTFVNEEGKEISGVLPSEVQTPEVFAVTTINANTVEKLIDLFNKGYGWIHIRSPKAQRRAIAHILFCMSIHYEYANLQSLVSNPAEQELLDLLDYNPQDFLVDGRVERDDKLYTSLKKLIQYISPNQPQNNTPTKKLRKAPIDPVITPLISSPFIDELIYIYNDISKVHSDPITQSAGQKAFDTGWVSFLERIGFDIKRLVNDKKLSIPSAKAQIENFKSIFRQGSLKQRLARLIRRVQY